MYSDPPQLELKSHSLGGVAPASPILRQIRLNKSHKAQIVELLFDPLGAWFFQRGGHFCQEQFGENGAVRARVACGRPRPTLPGRLIATPSAPERLKSLWDVSRPAEARCNRGFPATGFRATPARATLCPGGIAASGAATDRWRPDRSRPCRQCAPSRRSALPRAACAEDG